MYFGTSNLDELLHWIVNMLQCFDNNKVEEIKQIKFVRTRPRVHASKWWKDLKLYQTNTWKLGQDQDMELAGN